jgi:lipoate---protein ligase
VFGSMLNSLWTDEVDPIASKPHPDRPQLEKWRCLPHDGGSSDRHALQSDALSRLVTSPTLWWHWTDGAAIIKGAGQTRVDLDLEACSAAGIRVITRSSGGTAVYADPALLGLDVALPPGHPLLRADVVESYRWMGELWIHTLALLGVSGHLVSIEEARAQARPPQPIETILQIACFGSISPYEVLVHGRKLVGLSQVRRAGRALFQSGIYLKFEADALVRLLLLPDRATAARQLEEAATGLHPVAGRTIPRGEIIQAFSTVLHDRLGVVELAGDWTAAEREYVERQERTS